jgi:hypothetical protein
VHMTRPKPAPLEKAISFLFIPHVLISRVTVVVAFDAISLFHTRQPPPPVLGAIFCDLRDSRGLSLDYVLDGSLQNYKLALPPSEMFTGGPLACDRARSSWEISCRQCMESVMDSGGNDLIAASATRSLFSWVMRN